MMVLSDLAPGVTICSIIVGVSVLFEWQTGTPALVGAICLGMVFSLFWTFPIIDQGVEFSSNVVLKFGISCLGVGLPFSEVQALGALPIVVASFAVGLCLLLTLVVAYSSGRFASYGFVTGGGVGICGSAAIAALGACVPRGARNITDAEIVICIVAVTLLSAVGVILYPQIASAFRLTDTDTGILLGGTIHGVGQAITAGHSQSLIAGEAATITKLIRVSLLVFPVSAHGIN